MSFVQTRFPLPSVTGRNGAIVPSTFAPGRCGIDFKTGIAQISKTKQTKRLGSIRAAVPRTRLTVMPGYRSLGEVAGFWDSLVKGVTGAVKGFAVGGPVGAVAGGAGGAIDGSTGKGKGSVQQVPQQQLGPLAGISTGVIVASVMGFSALLLVLAGRGR
jgi:hypothetical protein